MVVVARGAVASPLRLPLLVTAVAALAIAIACAFSSGGGGGKGGGDDDENCNAERGGRIKIDSPEFRDGDGEGDGDRDGEGDEIADEEARDGKDRGSGAGEGGGEKLRPKLMPTPSGYVFEEPTSELLERAHREMPESSSEEESESGGAIQKTKGEKATAAPGKSDGAVAVGDGGKMRPWPAPSASVEKGRGEDESAVGTITTAVADPEWRKDEEIRPKLIPAGREEGERPLALGGVSTKRKSKKIRPKLTPAPPKEGEDDGDDLGFGDVATQPKKGKSKKIRPKLTPAPPKEGEDDGDDLGFGDVATQPKKGNIRKTNRPQTYLPHQLSYRRGSLPRKIKTDEEEVQIEQPTEGADYTKVASYWKAVEVKHGFVPAERRKTAAKSQKGARFEDGIPIGSPAGAGAEPAGVTGPNSDEGEGANVGPKFGEVEGEGKTDAKDTMKGGEMSVGQGGQKGVKEGGCPSSTLGGSPTSGAGAGTTEATTLQAGEERRGGIGSKGRKVASEGGDENEGDGKELNKVDVKEGNFWGDEVNTRDVDIARGKGEDTVSSTLAIATTNEGGVPAKEEEPTRLTEASSSLLIDPTTDAVAVMAAGEVVVEDATQESAVAVENAEEAAPTDGDAVIEETKEVAGPTAVLAGKIVIAEDTSTVGEGPIPETTAETDGPIAQENDNTNESKGNLSSSDGNEHDSSDPDASDSRLIVPSGSDESSSRGGSSRGSGGSQEYVKIMQTATGDAMTESEFLARPIEATRMTRVEDEEKDNGDGDGDVADDAANGGGAEGGSPMSETAECPKEE